MSQFKVLACANSNPSMDVSDEDSMFFALDDKYKKQTNLDQFEKLGEPKPPKPESTLHKVGRFLSGIIGGLLLAAGIAAATVATCGIAAGVAAAGIGLIATSVALRPKNPEALAPQNATESLTKMEQQEEIQEKLTADEDIIDVPIHEQMPDLPTEIKFAKGEEDNILKSIKSLDPNFPDDVMADDVNASEIFSKIEKNDGAVSYMPGFKIDEFVSGILANNGIKTLGINTKSVLVVRHAIIQYFNRNPEDAPGALKDLNTPEGRQQYSEHLQSMIYDEEDGASRARLAIFRAAISEGKEAPTAIRLDAQGAEDSLNAIKEIDGNATVVAAPMGLGSVLGDIEKGNEGQFPPNVTFFVTSVLKQNRINYPTLTPKNVLLIRHSLAKYFGENPASHPEAVNILNSPAGRQKWAGVVKGAMQRENDEDTRNALAIFHAAITATDLSKLDTDENLLKENLNNSMLA